MKNIIISTSNGLFYYCPAEKTCKRLVFNVFAPEFFGLTFLKSANKIIAAARKKNWLFSRNSDSVLLYSINLDTLIAKRYAVVNDVTDVHQIDSYNNLIFLTDTGKNRVVVFDTVSQSVWRVIELGNIRDDVNHINAVRIRGKALLVGLNNSGKKDSEILNISLDQLKDVDSLAIDGYRIGELQTLSGRTHTHDIETYQDHILVSSSNDEVVFQADTGHEFIKVGGWARGITQTEDGIWVGSSMRAERSKRHSSKLNGQIQLFSHTSHELVERRVIEGTGQVHDLLAI